MDYWLCVYVFSCSLRYLVAMLLHWYHEERLQGGGTSTECCHTAIMRKGFEVAVPRSHAATLLPRGKASRRLYLVAILPHCFHEERLPGGGTSYSNAATLLPRGKASRWRYLVAMLPHCYNEERLQGGCTS